jgi:hypothetical protein
MELTVMQLRGNIRIMTTLMLPILIGLVIPYILFISEAESWKIIIGTLASLAFCILVVKYQLSFLYFTLFSMFGIMSTAIKPFDVMFVGTFLLMLLITKKKLSLFKQLKGVHLSLFFFVLISFLSIISSSLIRVGFGYFIHTVFVILIFYFIYLFAQDEQKFKSILWGYIFSTILSAILVALEYLGLYTNFYTLFQGTRAKGLFLDPNDFSPYLILAILYLLHQFTTKSLKTFSAYGYLLGVLILIGIQISALSRAAMLNLGLSLCLYFIFYLLNRGSIKHISIFFSILLLSFLSIFYLLRESIISWLSIRFQYTSGVIQSYDTDRFFYQLQGLKLGTSNLFGIGPGQFEPLMNYATHNLFIRIIAENGWIAFLFFIISVLIVFFKLWKNQRKIVWGLPIYLFLAGYIGLFVNSFFLDTLHWRYLWFFMGLCCVLLVNIKKTNDEEVL